MKLCRFQPVMIDAAAAGGPGTRPAPRYGIVEGSHVRAITADPFRAWRPAAETWPLSEVKLLPPVVPGKIVCLGRNYREHAAELGNPVPPEPLIFLKPPSAVIGPEEPILLPEISERVDYEGEIAVIIGRTCSRLAEDADVRPYLLGFTCLNDVTARDLQRKDVQFTRAKGFDTFCPIGPVVETELELAAATVETRVNGERRQFGRTTEMIFPVDRVIRWISRMMTLEPGDVIATGTPAGVGPLHPGDVVEVEVSGVGILRNPVAPRT